jgi:hypothetical protein
MPKMKLDSWTAKPMMSQRAARKGFQIEDLDGAHDEASSDCHVRAAGVMSPEEDEAQEQKGEDQLSVPAAWHALYVAAAGRRNERGGQQVKAHRAGELRKAGQVDDGAGEAATDEAELEVVEANRGRLVKQRPALDDVPSRSRFPHEEVGRRHHQHRKEERCRPASRPVGSERARISLQSTSRACRSPMQMTLPEYSLRFTCSWIPPKLRY